MYFLLGLGVLLFFWLLGKGYVQAHPASMVKNGKIIGGIALLLLAGLFAIRGAMAIAAPMAIFAMGVLGIKPLSSLLSGAGYKPHKSAGQHSTVRTDFLEMILDHDSGALGGKVLQGQCAGKALGALGVTTLCDLLGYYAKHDPQSAQLLEAYLDHVHPDWQEKMGGQSHQRSQGATGGLGLEEAYQILGIAPGASVKEIKTAHKKLMKKFHPDQGGSGYFAAQINAAKDRLLCASKST